MVDDPSFDDPSPDEALKFFAEPGRFTKLADADAAVAPSDVRQVVEMVQGLFVYDTTAKSFYGVELTPTQAGAIHERDAARLLEVVRSVDARPLQEPRPPTLRVGARCQGFSRLTVALLRAAGVPARARCGFAAYFQPGWLEDHWVAEYWDAATARWQMVDAQLDTTWCNQIGFVGDPFAISGTQFVTAGHAWQAWRRGELDAARCGLLSINDHGAHWIAGNLRLDLASLNKIEMLPWDVWGGGWAPGTEPTADQIDLFDAVASLTVAPDAQLAELRNRYQSDDRLVMKGTVFNVLQGQVETVL
jgi:hypothetical protein